MEKDSSHCAQDSSQSREPGLLRAAGVIGLATLMSRVLGLVREQVIAILFGAGDATDAFNVAFRVPNLLRNLFAEGAMSASLVPVFTQTRIEEGERRAWQVAGRVFRVLFFGVGLLSLLGLIVADSWVGWFAGAFRNIPGKFEMTVRMTQVMLPFFPLVALAAAFMGVLNSFGVFFLPAFSSALFNISSVLFGVIFIRYLLPVWGRGLAPIEGMAIGVLIGGAVQALCQLPALRRAGFRWWGKKSQGAGSWYRDPALGRMLGTLLPGTVGLAATQVSILVNTVLATSAGPGAVSWLSYAFRLMQFPIGIFGASLGAATLPRVAQLWVSQDVEGIRTTLSDGLKRVFAINLPASAGLAFLGFPIIELIFQYGHFSVEDAHQTALALTMYALGLTAYSAVKLLVPACYAMGNIRTPVLASAISMVIVVILNWVLIKPWGFWSLALGTSLGAVVNMLILLVAIQKILEVRGVKLVIKDLAGSFLAYFSIAVLMGTACYFSNLWLTSFVFSGPWGLKTHLARGSSFLVLVRGVKMSALIFEGVLLVFFLFKLFRLDIPGTNSELFTQKMKKKLSPFMN